MGSFMAIILSALLHVQLLSQIYDGIIARFMCHSLGLNSVMKCVHQFGFRLCLVDKLVSLMNLTTKLFRMKEPPMEMAEARELSTLHSRYEARLERYFKHNATSSHSCCFAEVTLVD